MKDRMSQVYSNSFAGKTQIENWFSKEKQKIAGGSSGASKDSGAQVVPPPSASPDNTIYYLMGAGISAGLGTLIGKKYATSKLMLRFKNPAVAGAAIGAVAGLGIVWLYMEAFSSPSVDQVKIDLVNKILQKYPNIDATRDGLLKQDVSVLQGILDGTITNTTGIPNVGSSAQAPATTPSSAPSTDFKNGDQLYSATDNVSLISIPDGNVAATIKKNTYIGTILSHDAINGYYKVLTPSGSTVNVDDGVVSNVIS